jgi:hypothetical protein
MAPESADASTSGPGIGKSSPPRHLKTESLVSLLGALGVSAGILVLAFEEYWVFFELPPLPPLFVPSFYSVGYQIESVGYGLLVTGVLLFGAGWTMARSRRPRVSTVQSVFDRYRRNWGVGIGTLGYALAALGLLVDVVVEAGLLVGVTISPGPAPYVVSVFITGIGIAVWAIGAFLDRVSHA